jgi:hypothetical protein
MKIYIKRISKEELRGCGAGKKEGAGEWRA